MGETSIRAAKIFVRNLPRRAMRSLIFLVFSMLTFDWVSVWTTDCTWTLSACAECTFDEPDDDDALFMVWLDMVAGVEMDS
jgi:hypothetical protein